MSNETYEVPESRLFAWMAVPFGGFFVLIGLAAILDLIPARKGQQIGPDEWAILGGGLLVIAIAGIFILTRGIAVRFTPKQLEFPSRKVSVPWKMIRSIKLVNSNRNNPSMAQSIPLIVIKLTTKGKELIGNRQVYDSGLGSIIEPNEDICIRPKMGGYGPQHPSLQEFLAEVKRRVAVSRGKEVPDVGLGIPDQSRIPDPQLRPVLRKRPVPVREYVHEVCGTSTVVSDGSLRWVCNPLRISLGSYCGTCGEAMMDKLRWTDTGETLEAYRSRMSRHTPLTIKLLQYIGIPLACVCIFLFVIPVHPNIGRTTHLIGGTVAGIFLGYAALFTPVADVIPSLTGRRYWKYK